MTFAEGLPVVAHLKRTPPAPTETFVTNQIRTIAGFRVAPCYHHQAGHSPNPDDSAFVLSRALTGAAAVVDRVSHRTIRRLPMSSARCLAQRLCDDGADLLHFHYLVDARFFLEVKRLTGLPGIVSAYGYDVSSFPRTLFGLGRRYLEPLFREMELFLAMSEDMRRDLAALGCPPEKILVHYYGTDTRRFTVAARDYSTNRLLTVLACGTLESKKAQDLVLHALHLAESEGWMRSPFRVVLVGDGPMRGDLERQVARYHWQDRVVFAGHISHESERLVQEYAQADVFSLPSITVKGDKEGIPGTIVEAMAAGLPVVSTRHAGIPEIIRSGEDGLLVDERDVVGMARAFGELSSGSDLRARLGRAAAERAARDLDLLVGTRRLEGIYRSVFGRT